MKSKELTLTGSKALSDVTYVAVSMDWRIVIGNSLQVDLLGGPCGNRTRDQRIKSPLLYRTELTAHRMMFF
jgi:hypothetical protein